MFDFANGVFKVQVKGVQSLSGISGATVPVWTEINDQDDLVWHPSTQQKDNSWVATINASDHLGQDGKYICHAYITCGNGISFFVGKTEASMTVENYVFAVGSVGSGGRSVYVKNPRIAGAMQVPTWSSEGGQDDIVWYNGYYVGDGLYRADIACDNFAHAGEAISHVYMSGVGIGSTSFWVSADEILPAPYRYMNQVIQQFGSRTSYFLAVDTSNCFVGVYTGSAGNWSCIYRFQCSPGKPSTPTVKGLYTVGSRGYSFGSGYTCYYWTQFYHDYLFHSVLYDQGTFRIQDGRLGQQLSHGCVRLAIDHAKWIYDTIPTGTQVYVY